MKTNIQIITEPDTAIDITVTDAGSECLMLRGLVREAIHVLRSSHAVSESDQRALADRLDKAITPCLTDQSELHCEHHDAV